MQWLAIFVGGGVGAMARYALGRALLTHAGDGFPWGTLAANWAGCLAIGIATAWFVSEETPRTLQLFLATGVLGGFTTFSAFGLETTEMLARGAGGAAAVYVVGSVVGGLAAVALGLAFGRQIAA